MLAKSNSRRGLMCCGMPGESIQSGCLEDPNTQVVVAYCSDVGAQVLFVRERLPFRVVFLVDLFPKGQFFRWVCLFTDGHKANERTHKIDLLDATDTLCRHKAGREVESYDNFNTQID